MLLALSSPGLGLSDNDREGPILSAVKGCPSKPLRAERSSALPAMGAADFVVTVNGNLQWLVNGVVNPTLTLTRGQTYLFDLTAFGDEHPLVINDHPNDPFGPLIIGPSSGQVISFTPDMDMSNTLYYHCEVHYGSMVGAMNLIDPPCVGDLNSDELVNTFDFALFVNAFGDNCTGCPADLNGDNAVNAFDFGMFVNAFGDSCD